ncbi:MAG TPA: PilZ domain-containing protein [Crenotrichaceae bacterium]|nr:PilZ domain-containing protein [Crenotrichaceae bacterium]
MIEEQRQTTRHENKSAIYYTFPGMSERASGRCINLSNNGLLLECEQQVQPDSAIHVCLYSSHEDSQPLYMLVKIVWLKNIGSGQFHAGAAIKAIMAAHDAIHV